jgi:hypothetical protein
MRSLSNQRQIVFFDFMFVFSCADQGEGQVFAKLRFNDPPVDQVHLHQLTFNRHLFHRMKADDVASVSVTSAMKPYCPIEICPSRLCHRSLELAGFCGAIVTGKIDDGAVAIDGPPSIFANAPVALKPGIWEGKDHI